MAKFEITGKVIKIDAPVSVPQKKDPTKTFTRSAIYLDTTRTDPVTGMRSQYENYPKFEFNGNNAKLIDTYKVGDFVTITFDVIGRFYGENNDKHFGSLEAFGIAPYGTNGAPRVDAQTPQVVAAPSAQETVVPTPAPDLPF